MKDTICTAIGIIGGVIASLFGGWDTALQTLVIFMAIDYITGLVVAGVFHASPKTKTGALESKAGWKGLIRKGETLLIVLVACQLDAVIGGSFVTAAGFALVVVLDNLYLNALAFILIGLGCANIVPVFYSLLKYQKDMPISAAVTSVTSLGYTGVILGPALLGFVAHGININAVFELIALMLVIEAGIAKYVFCKLKM